MSQADVIGFLVSLWGMRDRISNSLIYQEKPWDAPNPDWVSTTTAVYLAHNKAHKQFASERFVQPALNIDFLKERKVLHLVDSKPALC